MTNKLYNVAKKFEQKLSFAEEDFSPMTRDIEKTVDIEQRAKNIKLLTDTVIFRYHKAKFSLPTFSNWQVERKLNKIENILEGLADSLKNIF